MNGPSHIRFSSLIADPDAYIDEMFQLHPDAKHDKELGDIEIKNEIIDSSFKYRLLEEGLFLFSFSSYSPVDAEYEFIPNPKADYFTLVFYFTENRTKHPIYVKIGGKFYSTDQISMFFNGNMNAEIFIKAKQQAVGIRLDIHQKWIAENLDMGALQSNTLLGNIFNGKEKGFVQTESGAYQHLVRDIRSEFDNEINPLQKLKFKAQSYELIQRYLEEIFHLQNQNTEEQNQSSGELKFALNFLGKNVQSEFPGNDYLANLCHISESSFNKKFRSAFHVSPAHYFKNLKMKEALRLLQLGKNVKDVSHKTGYKDTSAFVRAFKSIYGKSPAAYVK